MKNIFKIIFVIIGTLIGAGFASGQEMYIFFYSYGINGIWGLILSSVFFGIIIYKTLSIIFKYDISNYKEFINLIINNKKPKKEYLNIKNILNIVINIFILITFFIMVAGFGAYFEQQIKINHFIGSSIFALSCFFVFKSNVKGLIRVNEILIPILILLIILIGILNFSKINIGNSINDILSKASSGWIISSFLYTSYNSILLIPTLITLKNYIKNKKSVVIISLISILIIIILSIILFFILTNIDIDISQLEMPIVYVIEKMFKGLIIVYGFIIISSIFTTSISLGTSFLQNVVKNKKNYTHIAFIMCITSVVVSNLGFSNLVNLLYPIFGYLGFFQILKILIMKLDINKSNKKLLQKKQ